MNTDKHRQEREGVVVP
jgi:hypothetical protein